jgi:hypothetical protein
MAESSAKKSVSKLSLGWQVTDGLEPRYWRGKKPKAGLQSDDDLVLIPASGIASHTAIIAQSGSGKSFFLGRLLEEIILNTRARCVVLDPNADFQKVYEVTDRDHWKEKYDGESGSGRLFDERSQRHFKARWSPQVKSIRILGEISRKTYSVSGTKTVSKNHQPLRLSWPSLSMDFLAEEVDPMQQSDLHHCHTFVQQLDLLYRLFESPTNRKLDLIGQAEQLFRRARSREDMRAELEEEFKVENVIKGCFSGDQPAMILKGTSPLFRVSELIDFALPRYYVGIPKEFHKYVIPRLKDTVNAMKDMMLARVRLTIDSLCKAPKYIDETVEHFYFSKAREYESAGILQPGMQKSARQESSYRLEVIDLPSLDKKSTRLLVINAILDREWRRARREWRFALDKKAKDDNRAPTFIVVDEAHNLIPADPRGVAEAALSEQFRRIVAEGRKYGLFLILVSQRPDKLDPKVLSECENKAIMKLSSKSVLDITKKMLGLDDVQPKLLEKCLDFKLGRVLLVGHWCPNGPQLLYSAARRTAEGGRNLREEHWATAIQRKLVGPSAKRKRSKSASRRTKKARPSR